MKENATNAGSHLGLGPWRQRTFVFDDILKAPYQPWMAYFWTLLRRERSHLHFALVFCHCGQAPLRESFISAHGSRGLSHGPLRHWIWAYGQKDITVGAHGQRNYLSHGNSLWSCRLRPRLQHTTFSCTPGRNCSTNLWLSGLLFLRFIFYFMCMGGCFTFVWTVYHMHVVHIEARRGHHFSGDWSCTAGLCHYVGAGDQTQVPWESRQHSWLLSHGSSSLKFCLFVLN